MANNDYIGQELEIFAEAVHWKRYFSGQIKPYLGAKVLEVGAGMGATTEILAPETNAQWVCLEPDQNLITIIDQKIRSGRLPKNCTAVPGTIDDLDAGEKFDTILYIDVLEHIENDGDELAAASKRLLPGGHLIVLAPAYNLLFSNFDAAIGHFRRYNSRMMRALTPPNLRLVRTKYLDSLGVLTSLANKLILRQHQPDLQQILFWDRWLVPISRVLDKLIFHTFGRSIIAIWEKPDD